MLFSYDLGDGYVGLKHSNLFTMDQKGKYEL